MVDDTDRRKQGVEALLESLGAEIFGFLVALLRDPDRANEAYAEFCLDVWTGIDGLRDHGALRAWAYRVARHAGLRVVRKSRRHRGQELPAWLEVAEHRSRTGTPPFVRTSRKNWLSDLRLGLTMEEQALLILRVDRAMAWTDVALAMADEDGQDLRDADALRRRTIALRQRFARMIERLRADARARGYLR